MAFIRIDTLDQNFKEKLEKSKFYKLDFGLEDIEIDDFFQLVYIATLSGFSAIDISAKKEFINLAINAINKAKNTATDFNIKLNPKILIFSSLEINELINLNKDQINKKFSFLKDNSVNVIDLHFNGINFLYNSKNLDLICSFFKDKIISVNLSRKKLSNVHMVDLLEILSGYLRHNLIIEIEGIRYYENDFSNVLQTVSTADIINKKFRQKNPKYKRIPIILGNSHHRSIEKLALECDVPFNGININSKYLENFISLKNFAINKEEIKTIINSIRINIMNDN